MCSVKITRSSDIEDQDRTDEVSKGSRSRWILGTAALSIAGFMAALYWLGSRPFGIISALNVALILALGGFTARRWWTTLQEQRAGYPVKDERTLHIEGRAGHYSFLVTMYFMLGLLWYSFLGVSILGMPDLDMGYALLIPLLVGSVTNLWLRWYFGKKAP